jgi:heptosyltransferase-2
VDAAPPGPASLGRTAVFVGGGIGDALFHIGHFIGIAALAEGGKVTVLCKKGIELGELLSGSNFVAGVIGMADDQTHSGHIGLFRAVGIFRGRFDTVFFFHRSKTVTYAARLAAVPNRYGFASAPRSPLSPFTRCVVVPEKTRYPALQSKADLLLEGLGIDFNIERARLAPHPQARDAAGAILGAQPAIAIGLNAGTVDKQWGGERFGALIAALARECDARFLLYGGPDVAPVAADAIQAAALPAASFIDICANPRPLSLAHALLSRCLFYVGNDSHGLNLAVHSGIRAIGLFGPTPPLTYSPLIVPLTVPPERRDEGIRGISLENVLRACRAVLADLEPG